MTYIKDTDFIPSYAGERPDIFRIFYYSIHPSGISEMYRSTPVNTKAQIIYRMLADQPNAIRTARARLYIDELNKSIEKLNQYDRKDCLVYIPFLFLNCTVDEVIYDYKMMVYLLEGYIHTNWVDLDELEDDIIVEPDLETYTQEQVDGFKTDLLNAGVTQDMMVPSDKELIEAALNNEQVDYQSFNESLDPETAEILSFVNDLHQREDGLYVEKSSILDWDGPRDLAEMILISCRDLKEYYSDDQYMIKNNISMEEILYKEITKRRLSGFWIPIDRDERYGDIPKLSSLLGNVYMVCEDLNINDQSSFEKTTFFQKNPGIIDKLNNLNSETDFYDQLFYGDVSEAKQFEGQTNVSDYISLSSGRGAPLKNVSIKKRSVKQLTYLIYCSLRSFNETMNGKQSLSKEDIDRFKEATINICNCILLDTQKPLTDYSTVYKYVRSQMKTFDANTTDGVKKDMEDNNMTYNPEWQDEL